MGVPRSSYYRDSRAAIDDTALVERMHVIAEEWPRYGYRRMTAQLRAEGLPLNRKRVARLMRLHGLCVRPRRRYVVTTDSDHDGPIFPNLAGAVTLDGPDQLWVADITYIGLTSGSFVYLAIILDAWSRRVVGYALARVIDARLTVAALQTAIATRRPPAGCVHHSDRGGQYAAEKYRTLMSEHGLVGSMGRRGNPYDNAKAESFMKTLKVEAAYQTEYASFTEVAADLPRFLDDIYNKRRLHSALGYRSPAEFERQHAQEGVKAPA
jgi:putative transposase